MSETIRQTILIVDDNPENIKILGELLKDDFNIKATTKGSDVLKLETMDKKPDLILLDIMMPDINGYEICFALKSNEQTSDIPVIFITAKDDDKDEIKGFEIGAVEYITKPFNPSIVKARVRTHAELKKLRDILANYAYVDALTMIPNRRKCTEFLDIYWNICKREEQPISVIMMDVDHFKQYNDYYGHTMGDICLKSVAHILKSTISRESDLIARYGGEEFIAVLLNVDMEGAISVGENILEELKKASVPHEKSKVSDIVTLSIGVSTVIPNNNTDAQELIKTADEALYTSKENGRNRVSFLDFK